MVDWLALDARLDSSMYETGEDMRNRWAAYSDFLSRFHLSGYKKAIVEVLSEGFSIGTAGLILMLALAIPAFEETNKNWRNPGNYSVTFYDRYGNFIGKKGIKHDDAVPLKDIPKHLIQATLSTEDRRFYEHFGVDFVGTFRALIENIRANDNVQGGSTITQQLAKNLFLSRERSLLRKIKEAFLALWLEGHFTKDEILKLYLDRAYLGGGNVGVAAAAKFYFDKSVKDITLAEAAILAGMYKAPSTYAPHVNLPNARARANEVLSNMVEAGYMTEGQVYGARLNPANVVEQPDVYVPHYFLDWAFEEVQRIVKATPGHNYVLTAKTTVDTELQQFAQNTIKDMLDKEGKAVNVRQAALVSMEMDGAVRSIVGGKDYEVSVFNRATSAKRQSGSSYKPYVYLAAMMERGYTPNTRVSDTPISCGRKTFKNYNNSYSGSMLLKDAMRRSINTVAIKLSYSLGGTRRESRKKMVEFSRKFGIKVRPTCSMALGDSEVTLLEHTGGYAAFANGGKVVRPYAILSIQNSKNEVIYTHEEHGVKPVKTFPVKYVSMINEILGLVVTSGTGRAAQLDFTNAAGKTGTTSSYKDGWFMGYTGAYVTGVWYGNDNSAEMTRRGTGGNLPARTWKEYMVRAHADIRPRIPALPGLKIHPKQQEELDQLALAQGSKPKKIAAKTVEKVEVLPTKTKKVLETILKFLKTTEPLDKQARKQTKKAKLRLAQKEN